MTIRGGKKLDFVRSIVSFGNTLREERCQRLPLPDIHFKSCFSPAPFHEYLHTTAIGLPEKT